MILLCQIVHSYTFASMLSWVYIAKSYKLIIDEIIVTQNI